MKKNSLIKQLRLINVIIFVTYIIAVFISPLFVGFTYIKTNNERFYNTISEMDVNKQNVVELALMEGFNINVENMSTLDFYLSDDTCEIQSITRNSLSTNMELSDNCPNIEFKLGTEVLFNFTKLYILFGLLSLLIIQLVMYYIYRKNKLKIFESFFSINDEVIKIKNYGPEVDLWQIKDSYIEFEEIENMVLNSTKSLKEHVSDKTTLIHTLNHELKTPINKINSLIQAYDIGMDGYTDVDVLLDRLSSELDNMTSIINYSLKIFSMENNTNVSINVRDVLTKEIRARKEVINLKGLVFKISDTSSTNIMADIDKFSLVMSNLIENCTKYALDQSTILINITDEEFSISNEINTNVVSGTQKGLKLATQILGAMGMKLTFSIDKDTFKVLIKR